MKISFCISSRNRLWQIKETLQHNLDLIRDRHEIVLVNYGCQQGLDDYIRSHFISDIMSGHLVYFEAFNINSFHASKAKNLSHRLASGEFLFNLDGDNFLSESMINFIENSFKEEPGSVVHLVDKKQPGSFGRIGMHRNNFFYLGGYDESLMPRNHQDTDIINRCILLGLNYKSSKESYKCPIPNNTINNAADEEQNTVINKRIFPYSSINRELSYLKIVDLGNSRDYNFSSYRGRLNLREEILIDGFFGETANLDPVQPKLRSMELPRWIMRALKNNSRKYAIYRCIMKVVPASLFNFLTGNSRIDWFSNHTRPLGLYRLDEVFRSK
jgi:hypothetical protein